MTAKERDLIDQLRTEVHSYHNEVSGYISKCVFYFAKIDNHHIDMYGNPDDREGNPGLMSQVADLRKSRKILLGVAAGAWTAVTIAIGAAVSHLI